MSDQIMSLKMGGKVAEFIKQFEGKTILCFGTCKKTFMMDEFKGYEHDGGLADSNEKKFWVFFECPKCRYGHSFSHMKFFVRRTEEMKDSA